MIYNIEALTVAQIAVIQGLLAVQKGMAAVLVHPYHLGVTRRQISEALSRNLPGSPAPESAAVQEVVEGVVFYLRQLLTFLKQPGFNRLGFVFQGEHQLDGLYLECIQKLNPAADWVVVTTQRKNPIPVLGWGAGLDCMVKLGLTDPRLGGFYATVDDAGVLLSTTEGLHNYGCVNHLYEVMCGGHGEAARFRTVEVEPAIAFPMAPHPKPLE
jgi:hypothetical protein